MLDVVGFPGKQAPLKMAIVAIVAMIDMANRDHSVTAKFRPATRGVINHAAAILQQCGPNYQRREDHEGGLMDEQEVSLTDQEWARFEEIWQRWIKAPDNPKIVIFTWKGQEAAEWMLDKFRAAYDLIVLAGETYYGKDFGGKGSVKDVDREMFAAVVGRVAFDFFVERMNASANAFLNGVVTEIHEYWPSFFETAFKGDQADIKSKLPTKSKMMEMWHGVIQDHLDSKLVRDGRGGDRRSGAGLTKEERRNVTARKTALMPFWKYLISELKHYDYEDDVWEWLKTGDRFKARCAEHSITSTRIIDSLIPDVLKRGTAPSPMPENLMPASFALIHAAREMDISGDYWKLKQAVKPPGKIKK
jgi:hypothetical protein